jgi:hypothetical protein
VRCPYCFNPFDSLEPEVRCARCTTPHHRACFLEHGKCVILGCGSIRSTTSDGLELVRQRLEVQLGPERHPFIRLGGHRFGEPSFLEVVQHEPELSHVLAPHVEVGLASGTAAPGETVTGGVSLFLPASLRARAVRLILRTVRTTSLSIVPKTLLEREAVLTGWQSEGHLKSLGLAAKTFVRSFLELEPEEDELILLTGGITRWSFKFTLDPFHAQRDPDSTVSILSEVVAYVDVPAGANIEGRAPLHVRHLRAPS